MFSGIVEATEPILSVVHRDKVVEVQIGRPENFKDISVGDSVSIDGVCLTVESFDSEKLSFVMAAETLKITSWDKVNLLQKKMNMERSLRVGDRLHGHWVTGHVDAVGKLVLREQLGESLLLSIQFPSQLSNYLWKKGSVALQGVSLTINDINNNILNVCLIPESLRRTNLGNIPVGGSINLEVDYLARGFVHMMNQNLPVNNFSEVTN